jgi:glycosyltransferase involved in cell wall biosynthesis
VARALHVPAAILVGGSDVLLLAQTRARQRCIARTLCEADAVLAVSQHLRDKTVELGVDPAKVFVRPQGVDTGIFHPGDQAEARKRLGIAPQSSMLLWVGRMVQVKAVDVLLQACSLLRGGEKKFELYLVGDGPLRAALQRQVDTQCLGSCVKFVEAQPHDTLADWYRAADLTVLCSRSEGIPNVLRESLACGRPFVATAVGGIPEIAAQAMPLVAPDDPPALAQALLAALESPPQLPPSPPITWAQSAQIVLDILRPLVGEP